MEVLCKKDVLCILEDSSENTCIGDFSFSKVSGYILVTLSKSVFLRILKIRKIKPILQSIYKRRSYLCKTINDMAFLVTLYLAKMCLPWCLLNKQKKCVSPSEVSKTLGICKKPLPLN